MEVFKLFLVFLLLLVTCVSAKKYYNETINEKGPKPMRHKGDIFDEQAPEEQRCEDNDGDDELSASEIAELKEVFRREGEPGWSEKLIKLIKRLGKKIDKELAREPPSEKTKDAPKVVHHDRSPPTKLISQAQSKLSGFSATAAARIKKSISGLTTKWSNFTDTEKNTISATLSAIKDNIEIFKNAREEPVKAIQASINIIKTITDGFGVGGLVGLGLSLVSSLFSLFGSKGPNTKPLIGDVVRKEIDEAFAKYRDKELRLKAKGVLSAFSESKAYLDGYLDKKTNKLNKTDIIIVKLRAQTGSAAIFMGKLYGIIDDLFDTNKDSFDDSMKCIKYLELFAKLSAIRDMIITMQIHMTSDIADEWGLRGMRGGIRLKNKWLMQKLYTINYDSKILPYFDPDISVITDSYATSIIKVGGGYSRSNAGIYCIWITYGHKDVSLDWQRSIKKLKVADKPYIALVDFNRKKPTNCYWKLVPHAKDIYSIINKERCDENYDYCGAMLSWDRVGGKLKVNLDYGDPTLWELKIKGSRIKSKYGCKPPPNKVNQFCNRELMVHQRKWRVKMLSPIPRERNSKPSYITKILIDLRYESGRGNWFNFQKKPRKSDSRRSKYVGRPRLWSPSL